MTHFPTEPELSVDVKRLDGKASSTGLWESLWDDVFTKSRRRVFTPQCLEGPPRLVNQRLDVPWDQSRPGRRSPCVHRHSVQRAPIAKEARASWAADGSWDCGRCPGRPSVTSHLQSLFVVGLLGSAGFAGDLLREIRLLCQHLCAGLSLGVSH